MPTLEIITPSYRPDRELCGDLARSVRRFAPEGTRHTIIVPPSDLAHFRPLEHEGATIVTTRDVMPRGFFRLPIANVWLSAGAPLPPVRGWIAQQIVKLQAAAQSTADAVLVADSDVEFVRPFSLADYLIDGRIPLYRLEGAVSAHLPLHMRWDDVSRRLLGLPPEHSPRRADYICWPCLWDPDVVRATLDQVERVTGDRWAVAVGRELHFSEMVLYGVYAEQHVASEERMPFTADMRCPSFSDERALDETALADFIRTVRAADVAVMISAKSGTDLDLRRRMIGALNPADT
ncbi:DUF6492 family protein [Microbacterium caowuchunii]|uniref:Glycosyltransferase family 2 protein n=1 Tax=Microbacterium caowuchunii TaxID=2614638 RepID=A0A5N0TLU8_9MICO|nr:DUF6492 family protein [Microbacterium caowuchunii]KAA9135531.1 hypothetical protein F6B40_03180 [Microbacterium caowuchunii]